MVKIKRPLEWYTAPPEDAVLPTQIYQLTQAIMYLGDVLQEIKPQKDKP